MKTITLIAQTPAQPAPPEPTMKVDGGVVIAAILTVLGAVGGFIAKDVLPKAASYIEKKEDAEAELIKTKEETQNRLTERLLDQLLVVNQQNIDRLAQATQQSLAAMTDSMHKDSVRSCDAMLALAESVKAQTDKIETRVQTTMTGQAAIYAEHSKQIGLIIESLKALHSRIDKMMEAQQASQVMQQELLKVLQQAIANRKTTPQPVTK